MTGRSHVFTIARVTFHHLVGWLKASPGDLCYKKLFMAAFSAEVTRAYMARGKLMLG